MYRTLENEQLRAEFQRAGEEHEVQADAARRSVSFYFSSVISLLALALAPMLPHAEKIFGELTIGVSLLGVCPAVLMWTVNFFAYRKLGREHWFYKGTQDFELFCLHAFVFVQIYGSGNAISVIWTAIAMTAAYWASLRPTKLVRNFAISVVLHLALATGFWWQGKARDAMISLAALLIFDLMHGVLVAGVRRSLLLRAKRTLADRRLDRVRLEGATKRLEKSLTSRVGNELSALIDELADINAGVSMLSNGYVEQAKNALAELELCIDELQVLPDDISVNELRESIRAKCTALIGETKFAVEFDSQNSTTVPGDVARALLRVSQELTRNAIVHGQATAIEIALRVDEQIELEVSDNGRGFSHEEWKDAEGGIKNAHGWAEAFGGSFSCESPPSGSRFRMSIPNPS